MKQPEVQDQENTIWQCVQASTGIETSLTEQASQTEKGKTVTVVCTPSGGAQTVRLNLAKDWLEKSTDQELLQGIKEAPQL
jgi:hypothetical protein